MRRTTPSAIESVTLERLDVHGDERGDVTELHRVHGESIVPAQITLLRSAPGTFRGMHTHLHKTDLVIPVDGDLEVGLIDLRPSSLTFGFRSLFVLRAEAPEALTIPAGVAHGLHSLASSVMIVATSTVWDPIDDLACRWDDPEAQLPFSCDAPLLSERDRTSGSLAEMQARVANHVP